MLRGMRIGIVRSFVTALFLLIGHFHMIRAFVSKQPLFATIRATRAMASSTNGAEMLKMKTWAVVGDALNEKVRSCLWFIPEIASMNLPFGNAMPHVMFS